MTQPRKSYRAARALAVLLAALIVGPLFPRDLYHSWLSVVWSLALGMAAGQVGKAVARINERDAR